MRPARFVLVFCLVLGVLLQPFSVDAAQTKDAPPAPIPAQISAAKKVFIGYGGGEDSSIFSGGTDRTYNEFYAAMKDWGRYELVGFAADADLLFEIQFRFAPAACRVGQDIDPQIRIVIRDPKTHALVWGFLEHVTLAGLRGKDDKNFEKALTKVIESVRKLAAVPAVPAATASTPK